MLDQGRRALPHFFKTQTGETLVGWVLAWLLSIAFTCSGHLVTTSHPVALLRGKCHHCGKAIAFQSKYGKCAACGLICHPGCQDLVPQECGQPAQLSPV